MFSGGIFLTTGNSDQVIRVYSLAGPLIEKICELESHMVGTLPLVSFLEQFTFLTQI